MAKLRAREEHDTYEFWLRRRYGYGPRDPRFLELTPEDVRTEYWLHYYADNKGKGEEYEDDDLDVAALAEALENGADWEDVINDQS